MTTIDRAFEQYDRIKKSHPKNVILFRLGDFYESFCEDAETVGRVLGVSVNQWVREGKQVPISGFPAHKLNHYLALLNHAGKQVALVEQVE